MNLWNQVLDKLEKRLDRTEFEAWFQPTTFLSEKGETIDVRVPDGRFVDEISGRYTHQIRSILSELDAERTRIHIVADASDLPDKMPANPTPTASDIPVSIFNPKYRFGTFVVSNSNQLAYAASLSIAENPSGSFTPLFIYGGAGLGKTHLIQAIGQRIRESRPNLKIVYMSAEAFVTEVIAAIRYDKMQPFRDRYRSIDALLLDDIQSIAGKERT